MANLTNIIAETEFPWLGQKYRGKVRDNYTQENRRIIIATDRLSCFDRVVTTIPFKGRVLNQLALWWFSQTNDIIDNHLIASPHPNAVVVKNCEVLPVEVVVRAYLTGSAWRDYQAGNSISGINLPAGMLGNQKLEHPLITPSTKAEIGTHDLPISESEILERRLVSEDVWNTVRTAALKLFALGQEVAEKRGLIFVDTKYEFGICDGKVLLVDEIHTLDSSRFWIASSYQPGKDPVMLDKEPVRQWLLAQGFKGDGEIPFFSDEYRMELSRHYIDSYKAITGLDLSVDNSLTLEDALRPFAVQNS